MVIKEEGTCKMVDGSDYKIIGTRTVNITGRDVTVRAPKAVRYVPEV